ncbi:hypothetical protein [Natrinema salaciae]|uniref:Uncharacterized protein n=1 Tax=Natrinema salaciae TaxID=1186196 RepID=A0A1H9RCU7_9EURY|nr:hypothetical protein [Natrinema salaciae]SER70457.1 hypothetical protein SAMN04489841_4350 [Natrinema salaciae]
MDAELFAIGLATLTAGIAVLVAARRLAPRLDVPADVRRSIRMLIALIAAILVATGLGLVLVGVVSSAAASVP